MRERRGRRRVAAVVGLALALGPGPACGEGEDGPAHRPAACAEPFEAPLPDGLGGIDCLPVGASSAPIADEWPDTGGYPAPVVFVRPGAEGGDGTRAAPFGTLGEALATAPGSVALARGLHAVEATVAVTASVVLLGVGPTDGTALSGPAPVLDISGVGVRVDLAGVRAGALSVRAGARLVLRDVIVEDVPVGVEVVGAALELLDVSILRTADVGLWLHDAATADGERLLVRDGARYGIVAEGSTLSLRESSVAGQGRDGISLLGGVTGAVHRLERVASLGNGVTALRVEGAGAEAEARLLVLGGTVVPAGTVGGDGLYVGDGASLDLDADIVTDARRGHGSELVGNARTGVLASGAGTTVAVRGALIGSNLGPGVFIQRSAESSIIGYSVVDDNVALGIGVASAGRIVEIPCDLITATRTGTLVTDVGALELGDGLSVAEGTAPATVVGNVISDNARFGAVFASADATLRDNTGSGNRWGIGIYGSTVDVDATNSVSGRSPEPTSPPPTARGVVDLTAAAP